MPLFALSDLFSAEMQDRLKMVFSTGSLIVTLYFWIVRQPGEAIVANLLGGLLRGCPGSERHERLDRPAVSGQSLSILPTAVVGAKVEIYWDGRWIVGRVYAKEGSEFPWNMPPSQVFAKSVITVFDLGPDTEREKVYENQRLRFTFVTVEGNRVSEEFQTNVVSEVAA